MWFSFGLVTFKQQIGDDLQEIIVKRPRLNFDQNCHFHKKRNFKIQQTLQKWIPWQQNHKMSCLYLESAKKVKNVNFNTLERPSWIVQFLRRGTLDFKLFSIFSSKMGSGGIKSPIYPVIALIWNYALKMTLYSPPLITLAKVLNQNQVAHRKWINTKEVLISG